MYLEREEIEAFFEGIESKRDRAIFHIVFHRGLRSHEVGLLKMSDFRNDTLYVRRGKGSDSREYILTPIELRALKIWLKERGPQPGALFLSRNHRAISRRRLDELMKRYCERAGIRPEKAHMHALKHSCGTRLAERGESPRHIKNHLGHKRLASTEIYMHFSKRERMDMSERLRDWTY